MLKNPPHACALSRHVTLPILLTLPLWGMASGCATKKPSQGSEMGPDQHSHQTDGHAGDIALDGGSLVDLADASEPDGGMDLSQDASKPDTRPPGLPFPLPRASAGTALTQGELVAATKRYLHLLEKTRYFDALSQRIHGWPRSDTKKRYWYGTWWSGVTVERKADRVVFTHPDDGSDNNGMRTGPILEGTCYALQLWKKSAHASLLRRLIRGFNSWIIAMERQPNDPAGTLLTRAAYPASITSNDHRIPLEIDYSKNHPGKDADPTDYVRIPQNPHWGDIWIKNKRSKDDIGHMLRALATVEQCKDLLDSDARQDLQQTQENYKKWARAVEDTGWVIASYDKKGQYWLPPDILARFIMVLNAECNAVLAMRLYGRGDAGSFACGNGVNPLEGIANLLGLGASHTGEILRSSHGAAVLQALDNGAYPVARDLLGGLIARLDAGMNAAERDEWPESLRSKEFVDLITHAANAGVPLTAREVRWFHEKVEGAIVTLVNNTPPGNYDLFGPNTPAGKYGFVLGGLHIRFRSLALALGSCASPYRNTGGHQLLDCATIRAATLH